MPHRKISQGASAAATASLTLPVVSAAGASGQNKQMSLHTMLAGLGVPQYVEGTCLATATVAFLPRCSIFDIYVKVLVGSSAINGGSSVNIGVGTAAQYYGVIETSGLSLYRPNRGDASDGGRFINASGAIVAAAPTATAAANFVVGIGYFRT